MFSRDDIIRMAREADVWVANQEPYQTQLVRFAALVAAAECEKVAQWMIRNSYATGHGDTTEDLLSELEWQVAERERDRCCRIVYGMAGSDNVAQRTVEAIRGTP